MCIVVIIFIIIVVLVVVIIVADIVVVNSPKCISFKLNAKSYIAFHFVKLSFK